MGFIAPFIPSSHPIFVPPDPHPTPPRCALRCPSSSAAPWPRSVAADPSSCGRSRRRPAAGRPPGGRVEQTSTGWMGGIGMGMGMLGIF